jgi:nucleoside-diphosphate-sugar epimerase
LLIVKKKILVIGGTRFFGIRLVERLVEAGHAVAIATRGQAADRFGDRVQRIIVDRRDRAAMIAAFAHCDGYDVVYDQMCYRAEDAAISVAVFEGRVARYVMASTIEVYDACYGVIARPFVETDAELAAPAVDPATSQTAATGGEPRYSEGKRAAEAVLQGSRLPVLRVRIGHVLAGPEDFTGRLASYVARARAGEPLRHAAIAAPTSFIGIEAIADFLAWAGDARVLGAINAASHALSAVELHDRVTRWLGRPARYEPVAHAAPTTLSPFDYAAPYAMSTERASVHGYQFDPGLDWLDEAIARHARALAA